MEYFISDYLKLFITLIIPGFIYLLSFGILIKTYLNINVWDFLKNNREFATYFSFIFLLLGFLFGIIVYLTEQQVISWLRDIEVYSEPTKKKEFDYNVYSVLMMLRHLIYSLSFLTVILVLLSHKLKTIVKTKWFLVLTYIVFYVFTSIAYFKIRTVITSEDIPCEIIMFFLLLPILPITSILTLKSK
jgi:hypothetical protein